MTAESTSQKQNPDLKQGNIIVKVCGITRREDAEAAVAAGADAIGFIFYPDSPRYVEPAQAAELAKGLDVRKVGIFVNETPGLVEAASRVAKLDVAQLYGDTPTHNNYPEELRIWRAFRMTDEFNLHDALARSRGAEAILLDGPANGIQFDWRKAHAAWEYESGEYSESDLWTPKLIVAGGLDAGNVAEAIRATRPWGVDASSSLELSPGVKDASKVRAFVKAAKLAAAELATEAIEERA